MVFHGPEAVEKYYQKRRALMAILAIHQREQYEQQLRVMMWELCIVAFLLGILAVQFFAAKPEVILGITAGVGG